MGLLRRALLGRLPVVLGLVLVGLVFAPSAVSAAQLDSVTVTGSGGDYSNINISAQSGTSGQNASGNVSFTVYGGLSIGGPVTCLRVTGADRGAGTVGSPTIAVITFQNTLSIPGTSTVELVDNGGNGTDILTGNLSNRAPTDCSPYTGLTATLTNGRAVVFDAPVLPTSKDQCKKGGWRNYPQFKNQGDCVSFVATHGKNQPG